MMTLMLTSPITANQKRDRTTTGSIIFIIISSQTDDDIQHFQVMRIT